MLGNRVFVFIFFLFSAMPSFAQEDAIGRAVTQDDWSARIPAVIVSILIVLAVNAIFIVPIFRNQHDPIDTYKPKKGE